MATEIKNVNAKVDELEAAAKKYMSKDTVISIGGYEFTPAKLMIAATIVSSTLGALYGAFEVYKDYQDMKSKIAKYVAPDLSELNKKMEITMQNAEKSVQYTQDIKNDLKQDIRRLEKVVEQVERDGKQLSREIDQVYVNYAKKLIPKYRKPWIILLPNKYLKQEDIMDGETIKTLAEYISKLKREDAEYFKEYSLNQFDSNGVEVDNVETLMPPNEHPSP